MPHPQPVKLNVTYRRAGADSLTGALLPDMAMFEAPRGGLDLMGKLLTDFERAPLRLVRHYAHARCAVCGLCSGKRLW